MLYTDGGFVPPLVCLAANVHCHYFERMFTMSRSLVIAFGVVAALALSTPAFAQDKAQVDKGMNVYAAQKCALCHSIAGKGNAKGSLDGVAAKLKAAEIREWLTDPKGMTVKTKSDRKPAMKAYPNLAKDEVDALVAYMLTLNKK